MRNHLLYPLAFSLLLSMPLRAQGLEEPATKTPIAFLQMHDEQVNALLKDTPTDSLAPALQDSLKERINAAFDFGELSKRALGVYWQERTPEQQTHFVNTFSGIIREQNFDSFLRYYREGNIRYVGEEIEGDKATVTASIPLGTGNRDHFLRFTQARKPVAHLRFDDRWDQHRRRQPATLRALHKEEVIRTAHRTTRQTVQPACWKVDNNLRLCASTISGWFTTYTITTSALLYSAYWCLFFRAISLQKLAENIKTDFADLLPDDYVSVHELNRIKARVGGIGPLMVVITSDDLDRAVEFMEVLSDSLRDNPLISSLSTHDSKKELLRENRLLYMDMEDLQQIHSRLDDHIELEKLKQSPLYFAAVTTKKIPP